MSDSQETTRSISFTFHHKQLGVIVPKTLWQFLTEVTKTESQKTGTNGVSVFPPTERCSLHHLPKDLEKGGFKLCAVNFEKVHGEQGLRHKVKFVFAKEEYANPNQKVVKGHKLLAAVFQNLVSANLWQAQQYSNPVLQKGEVVAGVKSCSIDLNARVPLYENGKLKLEWEKDEQGEHVGDKALPIYPKNVLSFSGDSVQLNASK
jgi:hypothetical protein